MVLGDEKGQLERQTCWPISALVLMRCIVLECAVGVSKGRVARRLEYCCLRRVGRDGIVEGGLTG